MNVVHAIGGLFGLLAVGLLIRVVGDEVTNWCPTWAKRGVARAAEALPDDLGERYREEWLADLDGIPGAWSRLLYVWWLRAWTVRRLLVANGVSRSSVARARTALQLGVSVLHGVLRALRPRAGQMLVISVLCLGGYVWVSFDKAVVVSVDGRDRVVRTFAGTPAAVVDDLDLARSYEVVDPDPFAPLHDGDRIVLGRTAEESRGGGVSGSALVTGVAILAVMLVGSQVVVRWRTPASPTCGA